MLKQETTGIPGAGEGFLPIPGPGQNMVIPVDISRPIFPGHTTVVRDTDIRVWIKNFTARQKYTIWKLAEKVE